MKRVICLLTAGLLTAVVGCSDDPGASEPGLPRLTAATLPSGLSKVTRHELPLEGASADVRLILLRGGTPSATVGVLVAAGLSATTSSTAAETSDVMVHGRPATRGELSGFATVTWQESSGEAVQVMSRDLTGDELVRLADGTRLADADSAIAAGYEVVADLADSPVPGLGSLPVSQRAQGLLLSYADPSTDAEQQRVVAWVVHRAEPGYLDVVRWWLDDAQAQKIAGKAGVMGRLGYLRDQPPLVVLAWPVQAGVVVTMTVVGFDESTALGVANGLRDADDE